VAVGDQCGALAGRVVMDAWGSFYRSILTWIKPRFGMGPYLRNQTEHLLFGCGQSPGALHGQGTWLYAAVQEHSQARGASTPSSSAAPPGRTWSCSPGAPGRLAVGAIRWTAMSSSGAATPPNPVGRAPRGLPARLLQQRLRGAVLRTDPGSWAGSLLGAALVVLGACLLST